MMMVRVSSNAMKTGVMRDWGGEAIRVMQGGDEKPLIGEDTPCSTTEHILQGGVAVPGAV